MYHVPSQRACEHSFLAWKRTARPTNPDTRSRQKVEEYKIKKAGDINEDSVKDLVMEAFELEKS
jgi:hypothetical protein